MIRSASIFLAAILLPSLVLAWLAVRSARDQQILLEHQQAIISQDVTDSLANNISGQIDEVRSEFVQVTDDLLSKNASAQSEITTSDFDRVLRNQWNMAEVGFAVDLRGNIYSPSRGDSPAARTFREENERFLSNRENVEVYSSLNSMSLANKTGQSQQRFANNFNVNNSNVILNGGNVSNANGTISVTGNGTAPLAATSMTGSLTVAPATTPAIITSTGGAATLQPSGIAGIVNGGEMLSEAQKDKATYAGDLPGNSQLETQDSTGSGVTNLLTGKNVAKTMTPITSSAPVPNRAASVSSGQKNLTGRVISQEQGQGQAEMHAELQAKPAQNPPAKSLNNTRDTSGTGGGLGGTEYYSQADIPMPAATAAAPATVTSTKATTNSTASTFRYSHKATDSLKDTAGIATPSATTSPAPVAALDSSLSKSQIAKIGNEQSAARNDVILGNTATAAGQTISGNNTYTGGATITAGAVTLSDATSNVGQNSQRFNQIERQVIPQNGSSNNTGILSNTVPEESDFRRLIGNDQPSGALARFLDNKLQLMVWYRPSKTSDLVFGAQLNQPLLIEKLRAVVQSPGFQEKDTALLAGKSTATYCLALLDDMGHPVALSIPGFNADWKHPFVATEIGDTLPHWEAALYLTDPLQMSKSAHTLQLTIGLIVLLLVVAIVAGGSLIAADIRRQVLLAQQKTDFVSNVSHELKTPLTSIRMFADLLAEGRVTEPERQSTYLKIISAESARLTRLINNVLDFARQERGAPAGERHPCDMVEITRDVVETCLPHLEANGQNLSCEIESETLPIVGDRDALSQIVLNLISNAEKYGGGEILVRVRRQQTAAGSLGCVDVLDRGPGIPPAQVEAIFLPFHRLHDSLANGIPGSGLGLTLARRMARVHGGDISYTPRAGGGSCFTLAVPLTNRSA